MHIARLTKKRPYRWKVEMAKSLEDGLDARSGVLFLGPASAENARRYVDWANENLIPASTVRPADDAPETLVGASTEDAQSRGDQKGAESFAL
jgi:hypothetical protein